MKTSTYFALLAEFETAQIPLDAICEKYFGLSPAKAKQRASINQLPVPAFRVGSQRSPWLVDAATLAEYIDAQVEQAKAEWHRSNVA